jgi:ABC-type branched-subunit amino acid transport system substrate-binding protein
LRQKTTTRRQALALLAKGALLTAPAAMLAGCSVSGGGLGSTAALPPKDPGEPVAKGGGAVASEAAEPAKAALLLPLGSSIQLSLVAKGLQQAAELALFERNITALQLAVRDDKGTPEGAAAAATQAIADGAEIILGPLLGTSVAAVAPIARKAGVPVIAFSNDVAIGGHGVHLLSFFPAAEASRVASYAVARGRQHIAALIPDDALGRDMEPAFRAAVEQGGARVALIEHYPADLSGMMEPSKRIMDAIRSSADSDQPVDALFIPSSGDNVAKLAAMIRHHALDTERIKLIISSGWDNPAALREPKLAGAWLAGPDARGWNELSARFAKAYNAMPPRLASLAYDAVTVASAFATQAKGQRYTPANLTREAGFAGIDGLFRLTARGPIERGLAVLEIQPQGLVVIDAAQGFAPSPIDRPSGIVGASVVRG